MVPALRLRSRSLRTVVCALCLLAAFPCRASADTVTLSARTQLAVLELSLREWARRNETWTQDTQWVDCEYVLQAARTIAKSNLGLPVDYLINRAQSKDRIGRRSALFVLTAGGEIDALRIVLRCAPSEAKIDVLLAISYLPLAVGRELINENVQESLEQFQRIPPVWNRPVPHPVATQFLSIVGDEASIAMLEQLYKGRLHFRRKPELEDLDLAYDIKVARRRLRTERESGVSPFASELVFWRIFHDRPRDSRVPNTSFFGGAERWVARGARCSHALLIAKAELEEMPEGERPGEGRAYRERRLALILLGQQRVLEALPLLAVHSCKAGDEDRAPALSALAQMSCRQSFAVMEQLLRWQIPRRIRASLGWSLMRNGDQESLRVLERLSKEQRFDPEERKDFKEWAEGARKRLQGKNEAR